jgi:prolyl oligopeptidase
LFFSRRSGLANQPVLYVVDHPSKTEKDFDNARVLIDPNTFSTDGTTSLATVAVSPDARYVAYALSVGGSDWVTIRVREVDTGKDLSDSLQHCKFTGIAWTHDNAGFFYSRYPKECFDDPTSALHDHACFYHLIGNEGTSADVLVFSQPSFPKRLMGPSVTDDGQWLFVSVFEDTDPKNLVFAAKLDHKRLPASFEFRSLFGDVLEYAYDPITSLHAGDDGQYVVFQTTKGAAKRRLVLVDLLNPEGSFLELVPENPSSVIQYAVGGADDHVVVCYMSDAHHSLRVFHFDASAYHLERKLSTVVTDLPLPTVGTVSAVRGDFDDPSIFYSFTGFTNPGIIVHFDVHAPTEQSTLFRTKVPGIDTSAFHARQVFYESFDGTKVPMFVVSPTSVADDEEAPCLLYGYGGFNVNITPFFSPFYLAFAHHCRARFAVANIRGEGTYGLSWWQAALKTKRQTAFSDFQFAARYLIAQGLTTPKRLCICGGSNGGCLVSVCANQVPELYGCVIVQVPVADMLQFHKYTIGSAWIGEYGNPDASVEEYRALRAYSPVHNVSAEKEYPAMLICTSDHDDRCVPAHALKLAAELQYHRGAQNSQPLLMRIEKMAGHGAGKTASQSINEYADQIAFYVVTCGLAWQP